MTSDVNTVDDAQAIRAVMHTLVKRYQSHGYHDYATQAPQGTSLPLTTNAIHTKSYLACNLTSKCQRPTPDNIALYEANKLVHLCCIAYLDAYFYHHTPNLWRTAQYNFRKKSVNAN